MKYYNIHKDSHFFIFGAGLLGRRICDNLLDAEFKVEGFFDNSTFKTSQYRNVSIIPFKHVQSLSKQKKEAIVIISLINPFDHVEIKNILLSCGFSRIICKRDILKDETKYKVNFLYDKISSFQDGFNRDMILGSEFEACDDCLAELKDHGIINQQNDYTTAYIPIELIHAGGKHVIMNKEVTSLFKSFQGHDTDGYDMFWNYVCMTQGGFPKDDIESEKDRIISGRLKVYQHMVQALSFDTNFFIRHPVTVIKEDNIFNIRDGMHRTLFLFIHGFRMIPCSMPKEQYNQWLNGASTIIDAAEISTIPILHPYYYFTPSASENIYETRMDAILGFLADKNIDGLTALDLGQNHGWFARNFCRTGLTVTYLASESDEELTDKINHIEHVNMDILDWIPVHAIFDIVLNIDLITFNSLDFSQIERLCILSRQYVFIETSDVTILEKLNKTYKILKSSIDTKHLLRKMYLVVIEVN